MKFQNLQKLKAFPSFTFWSLIDKNQPNVQVTLLSNSRESFSFIINKRAASDKVLSDFQVWPDYYVMNISYIVKFNGRKYLNPRKTIKF